LESIGVISIAAMEWGVTWAPVLAQAASDAAQRAGTAVDAIVASTQAAAHATGEDTLTWIQRQHQAVLILISVVIDITPMLSKIGKARAAPCRLDPVEVRSVPRRRPARRAWVGA
jgi:hypothetical protein